MVHAGDGDIIVWTSEIIKRIDSKNEDDFKNLSHIVQWQAKQQAAQVAMFTFSCQTTNSMTYIFVWTNDSAYIFIAQLKMAASMFNLDL